MAYSAWSVSANEQPSTAKWNILGTNDAYFDGLIGSGTAWTSWTPTLANAAVGNGTLACAYQKFGKTVVARFLFTLGTTSTVGTDPTFTLPVTSVSGGYSANVSTIGTAMYAGAGNFPLVPYWSSTTTCLLAVYLASATYASTNSVTATVPFAYANTYKITATIFYEAA